MTFVLSYPRVMAYVRPIRHNYYPGFTSLAYYTCESGDEQRLLRLALIVRHLNGEVVHYYVKDT